MSQLFAALSARRRHHYPSRRCVTATLIGNALVCDLPPAWCCVIVSKLVKCVVDLLRRSLSLDSWPSADVSFARAVKVGHFVHTRAQTISPSALYQPCCVMHTIAKVKIDTGRCTYTRPCLTQGYRVQTARAPLFTSPPLARRNSSALASTHDPLEAKHDALSICSRANFPHARVVCQIIKAIQSYTKKSSGRKADDARLGVC